VNTWYWCITHFSLGLQISACLLHILGLMAMQMYLEIAIEFMGTFYQLCMYLRTYPWLAGDTYFCFSFYMSGLYPQQGEAPSSSETGWGMPRSAVSRL
jgi:hypothetical protein